MSGESPASLEAPTDQRGLVPLSLGLVASRDQAGATEQHAVTRTSKTRRLAAERADEIRGWAAEGLHLSVACQRLGICETTLQKLMRQLGVHFRGTYKSPPRRYPAITSFEQIIQRSGLRNGGCWEWAGVKGTDGYGQGHFRGRGHGAHRISWILRFGEIPNGLFVLHRCDNPLCVNPDHLWLGTHQENMDDMKRKGRGAWQKPKSAEAQPTNA